MCGIAGMLHLDGRPASEAAVRRMIDIARHRGPDATGAHVDGPLGLSHARLSIVDLSGGAQPMATADGRYTVTFNGEIFNHVELRAELEARGRQFRTSSDTEVILHSYAEHGPDCVRRMNGQWAFAVWDARDRVLFLSRDRLGVRPLYWTRTKDTFLFSSEVKSLFTWPDVRRAVDLVALDEIFTFWHALPPRTVFEGVCELPPGCSMILRDGDLRTLRHFELGYDVDEQSPDEAFFSGLRDVLVDSARLRLVRSDVPVGAYLSGGLDSTIITSIVAKMTDQPLETFSVTFQSAEFDESQYQQEVVKYLGVRHRAVPCRTEDIGRVFPDVVWHAETPMIRTAPAPMFMLSKLVRESGYKVVLTGEGSDELLGGYDIFKEAKVRRFWARHPESKLRPMLLRKLYPYIPALQQQPDEYLRAFFHAEPERLSDPLFSHLPRMDVTSKIKIFYSEHTKKALAGVDAARTMREQLPAGFDSWHPFLQAQYLETKYLLPGYILSAQGDRMAMAHGVEGRYPFLDPRVAEVASHVPPRLKMRALDEKHVLKRACSDLIPPSLAKRTKQPYRAPVAECFFDGSGGRSRFEWVESLLSKEHIERAGLFHAPAVARLADKARRGQIVGVKDGMALCGVLSAQLVVEQLVNQLGRTDGV